HGSSPGDKSLVDVPVRPEVAPDRTVGARTSEAGDELPEYPADAAAGLKLGHQRPGSSPVVGGGIDDRHQEAVPQRAHHVAVRRGADVERGAGWVEYPAAALCRGGERGRG